MKYAGALLLAVIAPRSFAQGILDANGRPDPGFNAFYAWFDTQAGINGLAGPPPAGTRVDAWHDRTGKGRDLLRVDADLTRRPVFRDGASSGTPAAVSFDGDDYVWGESSTQFGTLRGAKTIFIVGRVRSADNGYFFDGTTAAARNALITGQNADPGRWNLFTGSGSAIVGPAVETDVFQVHTIELGTAAQVHRRNGRLLYSGSGTLEALGGLVLGARYSVSQMLIGDIAEVLVYSSVLSSRDRLAVEGYLLSKYPPKSPPVRPRSVDVFVSGDGLYHTYRIPSILNTRNGTLIAFAEGRASRSDHARNDIVMRRSFDGGRTWEALQVLRDEGGDSLNNPCAMQIKSGLFAGRVILMYQRYPQGCHTSCVQPGYTGTNILRSYYMLSDDDGATWTWPVDITASIKRPAPVRAISSGPGIGIQKRHPPFAGRIVFPFNQVDTSGAWKVYAAFSDTAGINWTYGAIADDAQIGGHANEVQIIERADGALLLNARRTGGKPFRKVALSFDGGQTWTPLRADESLASPRVMASVFPFTDPADGFVRSRILYAGPFSTQARRMGAVHLSLDGGETWPWSKIIVADFYAYSVLTDVDERTMGCLYERDGYGKISFARFTVEWLSDGRDCLGNGLHVRTYGNGCPASSGVVPALSLEGCPTPNGTASLRVTRGTGNTPGVIFLGLSPTSVPFGSCSLLTDSLFASFGLSLSATGAGEVTFSIPNIMGLRFAFAAQALIADPNTATASATAGLAVDIF